MNYIKHLTGFFEKVATDKTLNPTHVSLYIALFQFWNCNRFRNPISINRDEVMRISKISSKATYHKCLKNLHSQSYISYEPSYNPFKGSHVIMFNFSEDIKPELKGERKSKSEPLLKPVFEQALNKSNTRKSTRAEQAVVPSINNTNSSNIVKELNLNEQTIEISKMNNPNHSDENEKEEKSSEKKEEKEIQKLNAAFVKYNEYPLNSNFLKNTAEKEVKQIPTVVEVKTYFKANNFPELEAQKFFNYFSSVGWLVGGKIPMVDWQAAAKNWIINSLKFNTNNETTSSNRSKHLNTTTNKDYGEPL